MGTAATGKLLMLLMNKTRFGYIFARQFGIIKVFLLTLQFFSHTCISLHHDSLYIFEDLERRRSAGLCIYYIPRYYHYRQ